MRDSEIHVGDVLRIRRWEDMEAEFGLDDDGCIKCDREDNGRRGVEYFWFGMRGICGKTFTVAKIHRYDGLVNDYDAEEPEIATELIEAWMLEPIAPDEEIEPEEPDTLIGFLLL